MVFGTKYLVASPTQIPNVNRYRNGTIEKVQSPPTGLVIHVTHRSGPKRFLIENKIINSTNTSTPMDAARSLPNDCWTRSVFIISIVRCWSCAPTYILTDSLSICFRFKSNVFAAHSSAASSSLVIRILSNKMSADMVHSSMPTAAWNIAYIYSKSDRNFVKFIAGSYNRSHFKWLKIFIEFWIGNLTSRPFSLIVGIVDQWRTPFSLILWIRNHRSLPQSASDGFLAQWIRHQRRFPFTIHFGIPVFRLNGIHIWNHCFFVVQPTLRFADWFVKC